MECLEQLDYFNINTFSDIDDNLKPINPSIQKDLFDSLNNLSNIISNGIIFLKSGIYENLKHNKGSEYKYPKDCKIISDVINTGSKKNIKQLIERYSDSSNSNKSILSDKNTIEIIVTEVDKENDENTFYVNQSMIKQDFIFNVSDSSMIFDESSLYPGLDYTCDISTSNQSMIIMDDANDRNIFSNDGNTNRNSKLLNSKSLNETDSCNNTLVNVLDIDKSYIFSTDNSLGCWDDSNLSYSTIQVNRIQVFPDIRNEYDDINLAKVAMKNQVLKNGILPQKLDIKSYSNDTINSNTSFDKDIFDITKAIVHTNVEKYNSMGMESKDPIAQINHSSSILPSSYLPFTTTNIMDDNTSNSKFNASLNNVRNALSLQNSNSSSVEEHVVINSLNNFASLQSKFNSYNTNNDVNEYNKIKSNHKWSYKQNTHNNSLDVFGHQLKNNINNFVDDIKKDAKKEKKDFGCQSTLLKSPVDLNEEQLITENINLTAIETEIVKAVEKEEEKPIKFLSNHNDIINENDVENKSISFEEATEKLINNNIIDGNLEDHIIIEEEDSIVGNAIEEALENKSYIIQDDIFMEETFVSDLSFTFDSHNTFRKTLKKLNENSQQEAIQENKDERKDNNHDMAQDEIKINIEICLNEAESNINDGSENIEMGHSIYENVDTISVNITEDFLESGKTLGHLDTEMPPLLKENQEVFDEKVDVSDAKINNTYIDVDTESETCKNLDVDADSESETYKNLDADDDSESETYKNLDADDDTESETYKNLELIHIEADEEIETEVEIIPIENDKLTYVESDKSHHIVDLEAKLNTESNNLQVLSKEKTDKKSRKAIKNVKETSSSLSKSKENLSKKIEKKKSDVKQKKIASKNDKIDLLFANNCVKAFTSNSLKQNIVNTRPIEHEFVVSFLDFDTKINSISKPRPKSKRASKVIPKTTSKPISKRTIKTTVTSESKAKPLTKFKSFELKQDKLTQTNCKLKTIKKPIEKPINNLTNKTAVTNVKSKKVNAINKKPIHHNSINLHITYPKLKRKNVIHYPTKICIKESTYYQFIKYLLPEYSFKFAKYELSEVMSRSYVLEAVIRKLSPEYKSKDYNPRRNIFKVSLPSDNIRKFNEIFDYIQNHMNITMVVNAYDLHFGNLSSIFIIIKQLQRFEKIHHSV